MQVKSPELEGLIAAAQAERRRSTACTQYIRRIRNALKREYAWQYLAYLLGNRTEPDGPTEIAYMARQGVRLQLQELFSDS
jgi:hypothetical protein